MATIVDDYLHTAEYIFVFYLTLLLDLILPDLA